MSNSQDALQTYDLLKPVVDSINREIVIDSIDTLSATSWKINTCKTLWASPGYDVEIGGVTYKITDLVPNKSITINDNNASPTIPTAPSFILYPFFFEHGTLKSVKNKLENQTNYWDKYPLLWLHDVGTEIFDRNPMNVVGRTSPVNMYALISTNEADYTTLQHDQYAIKPARNLILAFIDALIESNITTMNLGTDRRWYEHELRDHARFGTYYSNGPDSNHSKKLINNDISGTHLRFDIPFKKPDCCNDCCEQPPIGGGLLYVNGDYITTIPPNGSYNFIVPPAGIWLLLTGFWNDGGVWDDSQTWT